MLKLLRNSFLLFLVLFSPAGFSDVSIQKTEFIPIYNRLPEELIPLIKPFLDENDLVVAAGNQLIVKSSGKKIEEIKTLIGKFDQATKRLLITVIRGKGLSLDELTIRANVAARIGLGNKQNSALDIRGRFDDRKTTRKDDETRTVQTIDGGEAFVNFGTQQPYHQYYLYDSGTTIRQEITTEYLDISKGFYVRPRLVGETVHLEISAWSRQASNIGLDKIESSGVSTTLIARLGEWVELAGAKESSREKSSALFSRHESTKTADETYYLLVEELDSNSSRSTTNSEYSNPPVIKHKGLSSN